MNHSSGIRANGGFHHQPVHLHPHLHPESVSDEEDDGDDDRVIYHHCEVFPGKQSSITISDKSVSVCEPSIEDEQTDRQQFGDQQESVNIADIIKDRETAYKIEEQIEEITTSTIGLDGEGEDGDCVESTDGIDSVCSGESERRPNQGVDSPLDPYGLDFSNKGCARVAFPEFGLDIMDANYAGRNNEWLGGEDDDDGEDKDEKESQMYDERVNGKVKVVDAFRWEENWLFQKKRRSETDAIPIYCLLNLSESTDPVCMLIPNPSHFVPPQIGSIEIDQLSDLTEQNSVGSLEFSSSEDENDDENDLSENKVNQSDQLLLVNSSVSSVSSPLLLASSSGSPCSYPVNAKKQQKSTAKLNLNKSINANQQSFSLPPLKIPEFLPSAKRPSSSDHHVNYLSKSFSSATSTSSPSSSPSGDSCDPMFTLCPQPANVQSDILVQFCCRVKGTRPLGVAWYRNGIYIGGTLEKGRCSSDLNLQNGSTEDGISDKNLLDLMKIDVDTKDFRIFKHFTDHILEIKSTRVDLSGSYSTCVYNHINQHWIDFKVTINAKKDYPQSQTKPKSTMKPSATRLNQQPSTNYHQVSSNPPPVKQRSTKSLNRSDNDNGPKILSEKLHCDEDEIDSGIPKAGSIADREHRKWEESSVAWPDNPYTIENAAKRKAYLDSLEPPAPGDMIEDDEANLHALPYISPSKDMERYKRDYYVPNVPKEHETCNGVDEKIYSSSKYFSPSISPTNLSEGSAADNQVSPQILLSSPPSASFSPVIPTLTVTSCSSSPSPLPSSPTPSPSSPSSSSPPPISRLSSSSTSSGLPRIVNEHHLHYKHAEAQVLENMGNITSLVSVKELINRFSHSKDNSTSNGDYYRGGDGGINYGNSLGREGFVINSGSGISPRLITDKHHYEVPFKISCWHDEDDDDIGLKDETNDTIMNNNNHQHQQHPQHPQHHNHNHHQQQQHHHQHQQQQQHTNYHDENDNNVDGDNLRNYYGKNNGTNCHLNNLNNGNDEGENEEEDEQVIRGCYDDHSDSSSNRLNFSQRSCSEASLPALMSPPPPILPPQVQPRSSTGSPVNQAKPTSNRPKFNPIKPQHPLAVNSITGRCLNKEYRNWVNKNHQSNPSSSTNLMGSLSLYDINQVSSAGVSNKTENPEGPGSQSPLNEGCTSDDGNLSDRLADGKQSTPFGVKKHVRRMAPSIMKRASFWEKKCEQEMSST